MVLFHVSLFEISKFPAVCLLQNHHGSYANFIQRTLAFSRVLVVNGDWNIFSNW